MAESEGWLANMLHGLFCEEIIGRALSIESFPSLRRTCRGESGVSIREVRSILSKRRCTLSNQSGVRE